MSINSFTFDGVSSEDMGVYVGGQHTFGAPQRDVTKVAIPGRNGDLIRDNGRFLNATIMYNLVIMDDFADTAKDVRNWLMSSTGYKRLEDTYHPDHYRMARVADVIDFETGAYNATGRTGITFDCKPQRFLKSGETAVVISASPYSLENPTAFGARPLIRVYGSGTCTVTINGQTITLSNVSTYIDIDCETMNCYTGTTNRNADVVLGSKGFPTLPAGTTAVSFASGTTRVEITPRWWEL